MPRVFGVRPHVTSKSVPSIQPPAPSLVVCSITDSPDRPSTRSTRVPVRTSIPHSRRVAQEIRDVAVFAVGQVVVLLTTVTRLPKRAKGLGELEPDIAATQDDEVRGQSVEECEGLDVGHRLGFGEAGDGVDPGSGAGAETTMSPRKERIAPSSAVSWIVLGPTKRP